MATATEPSFTPTGRNQLAAGPTSSQVALTLTGTPSIVRVTNRSESVDAFVVLGTSSSVTASVATGLTVLARSSIFLVLGANTNLAAVTSPNNYLSDALLDLDLGN